MVKLSNITTVEVATTEEINPASIKQFLLTSLLANNIIIDEQSYCSFSYFKSLNIYEIHILNSSTKKFIIEPEILINFYKHTTISSSLSDLFILDNYFVIFKDKSLYTFKEISNETNEDIINFVEHYYKLNINNTYNISAEEFQELKIKNVTSSNFIKLKDNNLFTVFFGWTIMSFIIFSFISYNTFNHNSIKTEDNQLKILNQKYEKLLATKEKIQINKNQITSKITKLFGFLKLNNITIKSINYKKNVIKVDLFHSSKEKLLNFLTIYPNHTIVKKIEYIKNDNTFKMELSIEL